MVDSWKEFPSEAAVRARIEQFMNTLATGDLEASFAVVPIYDYKDGIKDPNDRAYNAEHVQHAMFQFIDRQRVLKGERIVAAEPKTWLRFVEAPSKFSDDDLSFEMPEQAEGEVLINVGLKGEMTDITARLTIVNEDGGWYLCFSNFDIM